MKTLIAVLSIIALGSLIYFGPDIKRHFGTRYENANRHIFEENIAYTRGTIEHLSRLKLQYETAETEAHKAAIRETILTTVSSYDTTTLPGHLIGFVTGLRRR